MKYFVAILAAALLTVPGFSKGKPESTKVVAEKDSEVKQSVAIVDGNTRVVSHVTSFVAYRTGPHTIAHVTMSCTERFIWDRCFTLYAGQTYDALIDYKHREVSIVGQLDGNLGAMKSFKNKAINVVYEEESNQVAGQEN